MRLNGRTVTPLANGQTGGHQSLIGGGDRIAVNRQLASQFAYRRQNIARFEYAALHQMADIIEDLTGSFSNDHY